MSQELGRLERPEAKDFKQVRKIYLVPLLYPIENAPKEYNELLDAYWKQVSEHIANLESKIGKIKHIFHESISSSGQEGLKTLEKINPKSYGIAVEKCANDAQFEAMEDKNLVEEFIDWQRCFMIGFMSETVAKKVSDFYMECSKRRNEYIRKKIDDTLKAEEAALLFINERHGVQFPADIEVFTVSPPALNEIYRWLRDRRGEKDTASKDN